MALSVPHRDRRQAAQRVKVGLLGLAAVLLLIGLASAVFNSVNRERPVTAVGGAQPGAIAAMAGNTAEAGSANEPLADLGVAPPTTIEPVNQTSRARR